MTIIIRLVLLLYLAGFYIPATAQQVVFERKFEGINILPPCFVYMRALPRQISELADGSMLILANSYSIDTSGVNASEGYHDLKKLDPEGNILWTRYIRPDTIFSNNVFIDLTSFQILDNGNILLIGEKEGSMFGARVVHLILLDADGQHLFDTTYANGYPNYIYTVPHGSARCGDGFVVAGETFIPWGASEAYVIKLNQAFGKEWEFKLSQSIGTYSLFNRIIPTSDGNYDCFGEMRIPSTGKDVMLFLRLNASGQMTLLRTFNDTASYVNLMDAIAGPGYRLMLGRYTDTCYHPMLIKTDENGNELWRKIYPVAPGTSLLPQAVAVNQQNEFLVTGEKDIHDPALPQWLASDIYLMKTDFSGNKIWDVSYGTNLTMDSSSWACWEFGCDVICSADGRYLVLGDDNIDTDYGPVMSVLKIAEGLAGEPNISNKAARVTIFPCPVHDRSIVKLNMGSSLSDGTFSLFDVTGRLVKRIGSIHSDQFILSREGFPNGIYLFSLEEGRGIISRGKVIFD